MKRTAIWLLVCLFIAAAAQLLFAIVALHTFPAPMSVGTRATASHRARTARGRELMTALVRETRPTEQWPYDGDFSRQRTAWFGDEYRFDVETIVSGAFSPGGPPDIVVEKFEVSLRRLGLPSHVLWRAEWKIWEFDRNSHTRPQTHWRMRVPERRGVFPASDVGFTIDWRNLAIGTVVLGLPLWFVVSGYGFTRAIIRRRHGRCRQCGYQLVELNTACPECGAAHPA